VTGLYIHIPFCERKCSYCAFYTAPSFQTLELFFPNLGNFSPKEFSVEVNPGTVDERKISQLINCGVNRISIGVQSFDFQTLETLGRIHSAEEAEAAFRMARTAGFKNVSLDLMFGVPGQTIEMAGVRS